MHNHRARQYLKVFQDGRVKVGPAADGNALLQIELDNAYQAERARATVTIIVQPNGPLRIPGMTGEDEAADRRVLVAWWEEHREFFAERLYAGAWRVLIKPQLLVPADA